MERLGADEILIVHGARSFDASGAFRMLGSLRGRTRVRQWHDFSPNPNILDLERGLSLLRKNRPDAIVAVGGGSTLDMAKLLCAFEDLTSGEVEEHVRAGRRIGHRRMGLVSVPTTAGSGAEATSFAVLYVDDEKFSVEGQTLLPDAIVIDPALGENASAHQRSSSGMDAIAQSIESLWAVGACCESRNLATRALRLLLPSIEEYVLTPNAHASRAMAVGSHLAGRAINLSKTTGAHALSYGMTTRYGVSHGHAVALTLGAFMDAHARANRSDLRPGVRWPVLQHALNDIADLLGAPGPLEAGERFVRLGLRLGLPMSLRQVGVESTVEVRELTTTVNPDRFRNNPIGFSSDELFMLLLSCHRDRYYSCASVSP